MNRTRTASRALAALLASLAVLACTDGRETTAPSPSPSASVPPTPAPPSLSPSASPKTSPSATAVPSAKAGSPAACPATYAAPDPARPVVSLSFVVADDKATVTGRELVAFTPDQPTDRLVFRLWANAPVPRRHGGSASVSRVIVDGTPASPSTSSGGTMLTVPLGRTVPAGTTLNAELDFTLRLPGGANERMGHRGGVAWFGSGFPLLAWQRGRGWATEPATAVFAEAATSEAFRLAELTVDTAPGDVVLGPGVVTSTRGRVRTMTADSVRDVMVAVGPFRTAKASYAGVPIEVGVSPGLGDSPSRLASLHVAAMRGLAARFGPFPYRSLSVAVVPDLKGGVEFPGAILLGTGQDRDATLVHEVAHEWFYALVGNNQGRDPWLDEAFATYAEALVRGTGGRYLGSDVPASGRNRVGAPMTYWESRSAAYYRSVYVQGAAMLLRARSSAGAAAWDRAMRCYVAAAAHRVATPADVRAAFAAFPGALAIMRRMGALPAG